MYYIAKIDYKTESELFLQSFGEISKGVVALISNRTNAKEFTSKGAATKYISKLPARQSEPWYVTN